MLKKRRDYKRKTIQRVSKVFTKDENTTRRKYKINKSATKGH
jgi:hypothetical protein